MATIPDDWEKARGTQEFLRRGTAVRGFDLRGADLSDIRLERVDASGADFREADFLDFRAMDCNFEGANFVGAALTGARFFDCVLSGANFEGCAVREAMFSVCMFRDANLDDASLDGADIMGSDFARARLRNVELRNVQAKQASFATADLSGADLRQSNFEGANFRGAILNKASWEGANLSGASFDPRAGQCMLDDALQAHPEYEASQYGAFECTEGDKLWHDIEKRGASAACLRIHRLSINGEHLEVEFERLDESVPLFVCYALIERVLLRGFLEDEWRSLAKRIVFDEIKTESSFELPD